MKTSNEIWTMLDPLENRQEKLKHGENKVQKEIGMSEKKQKPKNTKELDKMFSLTDIWTVLKLVKYNIWKNNFNLEQK